MEDAYVSASFDPPDHEVATRQESNAIWSFGHRRQSGEVVIVKLIYHRVNLVVKKDRSKD